MSNNPTPSHYQSNIPRPFVSTSHPHHIAFAHAFLPSSVSKSVKQSSEPFVVMRISPLRVKIMDLSSMLIMQPTTSPACQQRPNSRLPMFRQWPCAQYMLVEINHSLGTATNETDLGLLDCLLCIHQRRKQAHLCQVPHQAYIQVGPSQLSCLLL